MKTNFFALLSSIALFGFAVPSALAQLTVSPKTNDRGELALIYADILGKNRQTLAQYSWQFRVEVAQEGELKFIDLVKARYGADGRLQTTEISHDLKVKKRHGLIGGNAQDKNIKMIKASVEDVKNWILAYIYMPRGKVVDFFDKARAADSNFYENAVVAEGKDVLRPGDTVTLVVDKTTGSPIRLSFAVPTSKESAVSAVIQFRHLRTDAVFYPARVNAKVSSEKDEENLEIRVESFDFLRQQ